MANHVHPLADLLLAELVWVAGGFGGAARPCSAAGPDFLSWGLNYIIIIFSKKRGKGSEQCQAERLPQQRDQVQEEGDVDHRWVKSAKIKC